MCDKMAISTYITNIAENDPFLRLQMRAIEMFNCLYQTNTPPICLSLIFTYCLCVAKNW